MEVIDDGELTKHQKRRGKTPASHPYGLEMRAREGTLMWSHRWREWHRYSNWYETAERRDTAMAVMNRKDRCFEYRAFNRA